MTVLTIHTDPALDVIERLQFKDRIGDLVRQLQDNDEPVGVDCFE